MDPFQIRMDFSSQLRRLSASQQSIQKVVYTMSKHASRASDDLWDCIVREASKASLNARLNILFLIDALVTGADGALSADPSSSSSGAAGLSPLVLAAFRPLITRDLVSLIDNIVPLTPDGIRLNLASTRAVVSSWRTGSILAPDLLTHILDRLEARRGELARLPIALQSSDTEFSRAEVLQRIEEDRERQKRLRERSWILPPKTYGNAIPHPPEALSASGAPSASGGTSLHQTPSGTPGQPSSSSHLPNQTNASGQPTSTPGSAASKSLGKRARVSTADNAALTRDPLAALYGDTGPSGSPSSSNTPSSSALKRSAAAGSTPAKRKANGSLVAPPSTPGTSTANQPPSGSGSGSAAIIGTGNDSSAPIIIDDNAPSQQTAKPLTVPPPPNDALQIEMEEMWEITSDLNEDDFEAFAEEDGVGVGVGVGPGPGSGFGLVGPVDQGIKLERNGHPGQQGNESGNGNGKVGVTILGVASHNGPSTTTKSTGGGSIAPAAPAPGPGPADVVPRWWGSRAVFVQQRQQYSHSHSPQQPQVRNNQR